MYLYHYCVQTDSRKYSGSVELKSLIESGEDFKGVSDAIKETHDLPENGPFVINSLSLLNPK